MENTTFGQTEAEPNIHFDMNNLESDFEFKPLTEGLGFQNNDKKTVRKSSLKSPFHREPVTTKKTIPQRQTIESTGLSAFYNTQTPTRKRKITASKKAKVQSTGLLLNSILGFFFNFALVALTVFSILAISKIYIGFQFQESFSLVSKNILWASLPLFGVMLLFMESFLSPAFDFGGSLLSYKVVNLKGEVPAPTRLLVRTLIIVLSFLCLGLPLFFDFQGKLSDTKVIKK